MTVTKITPINLSIDRHTFQAILGVALYPTPFEIIDRRFVATLRQQSGLRLQHASLN